MQGGLVFFSLVLLSSLFLITAARVKHPSPPSNTHVYIVFTAKPPGHDAKAYYCNILAAALGSEKAAKDALIYAYSLMPGFAARLTPDQVARIKKQPEVEEVVRSQKYHLDLGNGNGP